MPSMEPTIRTIAEKYLVGRRMSMSLSEDKTGQLWGSFMPRRKEVEQAVCTDLYSLQVYDETYFQSFNPQKIFEKWAAIEVAPGAPVPQGLEAFVLSGGQYAVFLHRGLHTDTRTFQYIFSTWLPQADFMLDNRPHFELLGARYKTGDPLSEEEIWIPVRPK